MRGTLSSEVSETRCCSENVVLVLLQMAGLGQPFPSWILDAILKLHSRYPSSKWGIIPQEESCPGLIIDAENLTSLGFSHDCQKAKYR